jgi:hypothetical protein
MIFSFIFEEAEIESIAFVPSLDIFSQFEFSHLYIHPFLGGKSATTGTGADTFNGSGLVSSSVPNNFIIDFILGLTQRMKNPKKSVQQKIY